MKLIKTGFFTGISTLIKIIGGFVINKLIAVYVGPAGLAVIGQFQNFVSIIMTFANGAVNTGTTKSIAEYYDNHEKRTNILSTSFLISLSCSLLFSALLIFFRNKIALCFLKNIQYSSIIFIFGFTLAFFALNTFFLSVLNGFREIKKLTVINITSSLVGLVFTIILVIFYKLYGALLSIVTSQSIMFFVTVFAVSRCDWFKFDYFLRGIKKESFIKLSKFSLMALTTALTAPLSQISVRNYVSSHLSLDAAGFWQGTVKISDVYLLLITTSLSVYYLPRLSEIKSDIEMRKELFYGFKIILPAVAVMALGIFVFRDFIIKILFSDKFLVMSDLFGYQLIGDFFKIASWLLGYIMIARAMTKYFIATEIVFNFSYVLFAMFFVDKFGLIGTTQAFMLNYLLCLAAMIVLFKDLIFISDRRKING